MSGLPGRHDVRFDRTPPLHYSKWDTATLERLKEEERTTYRELLDAAHAWDTAVRNDMSAKTIQRWEHAGMHALVAWLQAQDKIVDYMSEGEQ